MVEFLKVQYKLGRVTEAQLNMLIAQGRISVEDKIYIVG